MPADDPSLPDAVVQLSFAVQEILGSTASEHDLSITQVRLLGILRDREPTMVQLAQVLSLDKSSVSGLIDRAERRDLVRRVPSKDDARAVHVRLTARGRKLARHGSQELERRIAALLAPFSARERGELSALAGHFVSLYADERGVDLR
jgi:DNA-binding MarR family transcriptional regulator